MGKFYIKKRAQMGMVASAQAGKRLSFLLVALATTAALALFPSDLPNNEVTHSIARWFHERAIQSDKILALPLMFHSFQEDLLHVEVAVGERAEANIDKVKRDNLQELIGI